MAPSLNDLARLFYQKATGWTDSMQNPPVGGGGLPVIPTPFEANSFGQNGTTTANHTAGMPIVEMGSPIPAGFYKILIQLASSGGTIQNVDMVNYEFRVDGVAVVHPMSAIADSIGLMEFTYRFNGSQLCGIYCAASGSSGARVAGSLTFTKIAN